MSRPRQYHHRPPSSIHRKIKNCRKNPFQAEKIQLWNPQSKYFLAFAFLTFSSNLQNQNQQEPSLHTNCLIIFHQFFSAPKSVQRKPHDSNSKLLRCHSTIHHYMKHLFAPTPKKKKFPFQDFELETSREEWRDLYFITRFKLETSYQEWRDLLPFLKHPFSETS